MFWYLPSGSEGVHTGILDSVQLILLMQLCVIVMAATEWSDDDVLGFHPSQCNTIARFCWSPFIGSVPKVIKLLEFFSIQSSLFF